MNYINKLKRTFFRNSILINNNKVKKNMVNLDYWTKNNNIGDQLAPIVYNWMLNRKSISENKKTKHTTIISTIGSIIGINHYNAVIWGSGLHTITSINRVNRWKRIVKYDVRAVRGPITKQVLETSNYDCSNIVYGDPAILMPMIYQPASKEKKHDISIITHWYYDSMDSEILLSGANTISVETNNYKHFIDEIVSSKLIISSSLHGIILSEAYGIPSILLNRNNCMKEELLKYYDWYYSTGRYNVKMALSLKEAKSMSPMELPELGVLRNDLISAFPYDLWE